MPSKDGRKTPRRSRVKYISNIKKGTLRQYGYSTSDSAYDRRKALKKAINDLGYLEIFRKLNAVYVLNKYKGLTKREYESGKISHTSKIFRADRNWVRKTYINPK